MEVSVAGVRAWLPAACLALAACGGSGDDLPGTSPPGSDGGIGEVAFPLADAPAPGGFELVEVFPELAFDAPLFAAGVPGEDRLVVLEQGGLVKAFDDDPAVQTSRVVLDLSGRVLFAGEQGLLGLAFDPEFELNRHLYVHYSRDAPRRSVISRFTWDEALDRAPLASEKVLLELEQPFSNHNAGMLAFAAQRRLLIAFGDGGGSGDPGDRAQDRSNLFGTFLRVDPHPADPADPYEVPGDNPFLGEAGVVPEIWAYGFRNPFRFSVDRQTGRVWAGDVGQSDREEVDVVVAGGNYGWRVFEGTLRFADSAHTPADFPFEEPVLDYDRSEGGTVIGGYVYRGTRLPSLHGAYVYGDFISGRIWALTLDAGGAVTNTQIGVLPQNRITSFGEKNDGELVVVTAGGTLFELEPTGGGSGTVPPATLSAAGIFDDLDTLATASGFVEYAVNAPALADGARVRRWLGVPDGETITFAETGAWTFPAGSILVQHLERDLAGGTRPVETRVLVVREQGVAGYSYRWRASAAEADLLGRKRLETLTRASGGDLTHEYPARLDCLDCHNPAAGGVLGVRTRQMNRSAPGGGDNQLEALAAMGLFDGDIGAADALPAFPDPFDEAADLSDRARAYLDANCASCHRPGGGTGVALDLRFETAAAEAGAIDVAPAEGDLGLAGARIVDPGSKETSVLWERMRRLDRFAMPPVTRHAVDDAGVDLVGRWIDAL